MSCPSTEYRLRHGALVLTVLITSGSIAACQNIAASSTQRAVGSGLPDLDDAGLGSDSITSSRPTMNDAGIPPLTACIATQQAFLERTVPELERLTPEQVIAYLLAHGQIEQLPSCETGRAD